MRVQLPPGPLGRRRARQRKCTIRRARLGDKKNEPTKPKAGSGASVVGEGKATPNKHEVTVLDITKNGCVLCRLGVPGGSGPLELHHCPPRSQGGFDDPARVAWLCKDHHLAFGHGQVNTQVCWHAKVALGQSRPQDYAELWDNTKIPYWCECIGEFGYGDRWFSFQNGKGIATAQRLYQGRVDARLHSFCTCLCPKAIECLSETRKRVYAEVEAQ